MLRMKGLDEEIATNYSISCQKLVQPLRIDIAVEDEDFVLKNFGVIRAAGFLIRECHGSFYLDALPNFMEPTHHLKVNIYLIHICVMIIVIRF